MPALQLSLTFYIHNIFVVYGQTNIRTISRISQQKIAQLLSQDSNDIAAIHDIQQIYSISLNASLNAIKLDIEQIFISIFFYIAA